MPVLQKRHYVWLYALFALIILVSVGIFLWVTDYRVPGNILATQRETASEQLVSEKPHVGRMVSLDIKKGEKYIVEYSTLAEAIYGSPNTERFVATYIIPIYGWYEGTGHYGTNLPHYSLVTLVPAGDAQVFTFALVDEKNKTIVRTYSKYNLYALQAWTDDGRRIYLDDGPAGSNTVLKIENYVTGTSTVLYEEKESGVTLVNVCEYDCYGLLSYEKIPVPTVYFVRYRKGVGTTLNTQIEAKSVQIK